MDRSGKILTILAAIGLIAVLVHQRRGPDTVSTRLGVSTVPGSESDIGPAYLLSNLPAHRRSDDYARPVSK